MLENKSVKQAIFMKMTPKSPSWFLIESEVLMIKLKVTIHSILICFVATCIAAYTSYTSRFVIPCKKQ